MMDASMPELPNSTGGAIPPLPTVEPTVEPTLQPKSDTQAAANHPTYGMPITAGTPTPAAILVPAIAPCDRAPASATMHSMSFADFPSPSNVAPPRFLVPSIVNWSLRHSRRLSVPPPKRPFLFLSEDNDLCDSRIAGSFALYSIVYPSFPASTLYDE